MRVRPFPTLLTPRLELRQLRAGDEEFLARLDADPVVMRHIHTGPLSQDAALRYAQLQVEAAAYRSRWGKWLAVLRHDGLAVGWVELGKLSGADRDDIQLGYELATEHWGQGYATEAASGVLEYAFGRLEMDRIAAIARPANTRSLRILEKLGFHPVGRRHDDGRELCNEYRVTAEEWRRLSTSGWTTPSAHPLAAHERSSSSPPISRRHPRM